jgi:hypothetical protein
VQGHGGQVEGHNRDGNRSGALFSVCLPAAPDQDSQDENREIHLSSEETL